MKCRLLGPTLVTAVMFCGVCQGVLVQWSSDVGGNDHFYEVVRVPSGINWYQANNSAMLSGGHLATITSAAENSFVYSILDYNTDFIGEWDWGTWLGGYQPAGSPEPSGGWRWVTGEPFTYTNWKPGNPDNGGGIEHFLHFLQGPQWNDIAPYGAWNSIPLQGYIVEYIPEPATLLFLGFGGLSVFRRRA